MSEDFKKNDSILRAWHNKVGRVYQSPLEKVSKGHMPQWLVNKILGRYE